MRDKRNEREDSREKKEVAVTAKRLNMRSGPSPTSDVLTVLTEGTRLLYLDSVGEYVHVRTQVGEIRSGYVLRQYVREI